MSQHLERKRYNGARSCGNVLRDYCETSANQKVVMDAFQISQSRWTLARLVTKHSGEFYLENESDDPPIPQRKPCVNLSLESHRAELMRFAHRQSTEFFSDFSAAVGRSSRLPGTSQLETWQKHRPQVHSNLAPAISLSWSRSLHRSLPRRTTKLFFLASRTTSSTHDSFFLTTTVVAVKQATLTRRWSVSCLIGEADDTSRSIDDYQQRLVTTNGTRTGSHQTA